MVSLSNHVDTAQRPPIIPSVNSGERPRSDPLAGQEGKKEVPFDKEDKVDAFTAEGEALSYISLDQARLLAMQTARYDRAYYSGSFEGTSMVFDVVEEEETEDHYVVSLSFRPAGDFRGRPGLEQFFVKKEGGVAHRQVRSLPRNRTFPFVAIAIGLAVVAAVAMGLGVAFALDGGGEEVAPAAAVGFGNTPTAAPTRLLPTSSPVPGVAVVPTPIASATATASPPTTSAAVSVPATATHTASPVPPTPTITPTPVPPTATPILLTPTRTPSPTPVALAAAGKISTVAGNGTSGFSGDGGSATSAQVNFPFDIAADSSGNLFIADQNNHRIRKVDTSGNISTVAGTGASGFSGDGGPATSARLAGPSGVAVDPSGNLFITDRDNHRIRKVEAVAAPTAEPPMATPVPLTGRIAFVSSRDGNPEIYLMSADGSGQRGTLKKCVNSQAVYPLCEQNGLEAQERRYTAHEEGKH